MLNDINRELVTLYRVVKWHLEEFIKCFKWLLVSRNEFQRFLAENPETLTDVWRAVRFYYLIRTSHGAHVDSPTFGVATTRPPRLNLLRIEEELSAAHLRLAQVTIENLGYGDFIERYDRPHTLFYVDPPYWACEDYYGKGLFERADFERLMDQLAGIKGRFVMSINNVPEIREMFGQFDIMEASTKYSVGAGGRQTNVTELVIANFDLPRG